jgi:hypothetical protein
VREERISGNGNYRKRPGGRKENDINVEAKALTVAR